MKILLQRERREKREGHMTNTRLRDLNMTSRMRTAIQSVASIKDSG